MRDLEDLKRCIDYVHWNPKKHGYVENVRDWPWSTFHRYVSLGEYTCNSARRIRQRIIMPRSGANRLCGGKGVGWEERSESHHA